MSQHDGLIKRASEVIKYLIIDELSNDANEIRFASGKFLPKNMLQVSAIVWLGK